MRLLQLFNSPLLQAIDDAERGARLREAAFEFVAAEDALLDAEAKPYSEWVMACERLDAARKRLREALGTPEA